MENNEEGNDFDAQRIEYEARRDEVLNRLRGMEFDQIDIHGEMMGRILGDITEIFENELEEIEGQIQGIRENRDIEDGENDHFLAFRNRNLDPMVVLRPPVLEEVVKSFGILSNGSISLLHQPGSEKFENDFTFRCWNSGVRESSHLQFETPTLTKSRVEQMGNWKYFEVTIRSLPTVPFNRYAFAFGIGMAPKGFYPDPNSRRDADFVGWHSGSIGYHSDNGGIYDNFGMLTSHPDKHKYQKVRYKENDVIGVSFNEELKKDNVYFTLNGEDLVFRGSRNFKEKRLFPSISIATARGEKFVEFELNFGQNTQLRPFKYEKFNFKPYLEMKEIRKKGKFIDLIVKTVQE